MMDLLSKILNPMQLNLGPFTGKSSTTKTCLLNEFKCQFMKYAGYVPSLRKMVSSVAEAEAFHRLNIIPKWQNIITSPKNGGIQYCSAIRDKTWHWKVHVRLLGCFAFRDLMDCAFVYAWASQWVPFLGSYSTMLYETSLELQRTNLGKMEVDTMPAQACEQMGEVE